MKNSIILQLWSVRNNLNYHTHVSEARRSITVQHINKIAPELAYSAGNHGLELAKNQC